jgi:hypothetical protein
MFLRHLGQWFAILTVAFVVGGVLGACGGGGQNVTAGAGGKGSTTSAGGGGFIGFGGSSACVPKTCAEAGYTCGMNGDGCGNVIDCGSCTAPEFCGGGGYSKCGGAPTGPDGGPINPCTPYTCATAPNGPYNCGKSGDGCDGTISCGVCPLTQFCGGGGFNQCGGSTGLEPDGGVICVPATSCPAGQDCGQAADGCGGLISCGSCTNPQFCGGAGPSKCGGNNGMAPDAGPPCVPATSCPAGQNCGQAADGCGGLINCGTCTNPQFCGGGGPGICGGNDGFAPDGSVLCTPTTCAALGNPCGAQGDGCGGVLHCTQCVMPQTCGGGGVPSQCGGSTGLGPDGGVLCTPKTCASFPAGTCGKQDDGCGGVTANCGSCVLPDTCGGGGVPSQCGNSHLLPDGGNPCTPATTCPAGMTCGQAADGCGGVINCGSCALPDICGGGGVPGQCGNSGLLPDGGNPCTPTTCAALGYTCGAAGDGCGGMLSCGTCTNPQFCGGGGPNVCGGNNGLEPDGGIACTPTTCAALGYNCGFASDGCGGVLSCGTCTNPQFCGGGGFDVCGPTSVSVCPGGGSTTYSGYVYDPGNHLPVYNALVYVPVGAVQVPTTGVDPANPTCGCTAPPAYASAYTNIAGAFTLTNVPSGSTKIVVQLGKWQRVFTQNITSCAANTASNGAYGSHLTLPSTHLQGNIPLFAIDTGGVDSMECVLSKMGIATSEFVDPDVDFFTGLPTNPGRVHFYQGLIWDGGAIIDGNTPTEDVLTETAATMNSYDVILFPCQGWHGSYTAANGWPNTLGNLTSYANAGGRFFATHFHYDLIQGNGSGNGSLGASATWSGLDDEYGEVYSDPTYNTDIDMSFPVGVTLAQWLNQATVYGGTYGVIPVGTIRDNIATIVPPSQRWLYTETCKAGGVACTTNAQCCSGTCAGGACTNPPAPYPPANIPFHYTFDTPFNQSPTCGRVVYSDFHVESQTGTASNPTDYNGFIYPDECPGGATGAMTTQEKLLEFMLFDLTSCVSPPTCTPLTCADFPGKCGVQGDGCGGKTANCGSCPAGQSCGGGGVPSVCGAPSGGSCTPKSCAQQGITCGPAGNGCGALLQCGPCVAPATCGGGGVHGQCGYPTANCVPLTCASYPNACGEQSDGCGGHTAFCNPCTPPATCGGGGVPDQCGFPGTSCTPQTCAQLGLQCGFGADGCGGVTAQCGTCPAGSACVGNHCVAADAGGSCVPQTCAQLGIHCGLSDDGCGNLLTCPTCPAGQSCEFNQCVMPPGDTCTPLTCANFPMTTCGEQSDGCGGHTANCNPCTPPDTCGGGGTPNQCGRLDGGSCTPLTCASFPSTTCGPQADGCGGVTAFCNPCTSPATCGGGGVAGECGSPDAGSCVPETCADQMIGCGPAGDGCGNVIQCGPCTPPETCGGGGTPSQCGMLDAGMCVPLSCAAQNIACGPAGDGCGNLIQCGSCTGGQTCGGGGTPGQCGGGTK